MKNRARLLTTISLLLCAGAHAPLAAAHQDPERDFRDSEMRRDALNRVSEAPHSRPTPRGRGMAIPERSQDFKRIRALNDELRQQLMQGGGLDLEFVAKSVSEINKCAKRLKYGLALPKPGVSPKSTGTEGETGPDQLRSSLKVLGELIVAFVNNPAFKDTRIVNANSLVKAGRDLEEIIGLSSRVKKSSEKMAAGENALREGSNK
jgi:hypothetical protein